MNLELQDPFGQYFPETIFDRLADEEAATTTTCAYNRRANLVAAGTRDGRCLIWDLDTRAIALRLKGHAQPITSVSWTRRGRHVLTSSRDWNCIVWDLKSSSRRYTAKFKSPVLEAQMHPRNKDMFVALVVGDSPILVKFSKTKSGRLEKITLKMDLASEVAYNESAVGSKPLASEIQTTTALFSPNGELIYVGTKKGHVYVFRSDNAQLQTILMMGTSAIKQICFNRDGRNMLVNTHDRTIRCFVLDYKDNGTILFELLNKYQDSVDRNQWTKCCFSADGDMVVGALSSSQKHNIFIWDKTMGNLVKMLEGPREGLVDMVWHPTRPIIATVSHFGVIYFWGVAYTQNYSAFAPFFTELEDNRDYQEQEDEFDQDIDDDKNMGVEAPPSPTIDVDVVTKDRGIYVSDTDDSGWDSDEFPDISSTLLGIPPLAKLPYQSDGVCKNSESLVRSELDLEHEMDVDEKPYSKIKQPISRQKRLRPPFVIPMNI
ncbi:chromatin binding protein [Batrachochytrium dendrobatidis]|nr:chromatin binding protein [Batrachochytrium dendrobatidis]KAK5668919.1 chromatin binding protein [Batrachochytrium dendrobatidis]